MDVLLEEFRVFRCMRIVAAPAVHGGCLDINVGLFERIRFHIVTLTAGIQNGLGEKRVLGRSVRFMAHQTITRCRRMHGLLPHPVLHGLMTGQAKIGRLGQQQFFEPRMMGAVALRAETVLNGFVPAFGCLQIFPCFLMTFETYHGLTLEEHAVIAAGMRVMASQALAFREGRMNDVVLDLFHENAVALFTHLCP